MEVLISRGPESLDSFAFSGLRVSMQGPTAWLEYNRPPVNAFDWPMLRATRDALRELSQSPSVRVIVIASALPKHFNSGADLRVFDAMAPAEMREWVTVCHEIVAVMRQSSKPMLGCIEGTAVGGGLELVLHCDLRFAAADARLGQPEVHIGFIPPIGATQALARMLGRSRALRYLYDGALLTSEQALELGLIDVILPPGTLRENVSAYAAELQRRPAAALAAIRRCVIVGGSDTFEMGMAVEREAAVELAGNADFREGIRAFLEKRPARWKHRLEPEQESP